MFHPFSVSSHKNDENSIKKEFRNRSKLSVKAINFLPEKSKNISRDPKYNKTFLNLRSKCLNYFFFSCKFPTNARCESASKPNKLMFF